MTKIRKQKRKKRYRYNVNRKRQSKRQKKGVTIPCKEIKNAWESGKSVQENMADMGLAYDPNKVLPIPTVRERIMPRDEIEEKPEPMETEGPRKLYVAENLEAAAKAPRVKKFALPKSQCEWLTYMIKKYGEDYKAMVRDAKNTNQYTWKQIRAKIKVFKGIPEQYSSYINSEDKPTT
ncbi:nucleolar protein 16 [Schistocerca gregaria]|uniref:nucleolar protein 16 n=1 Tax=Schistocerca gregaria TaxID=7010 RepID=UPI00211EC52E|nr:nucleolar protein 16 [Schistocerca gregaria]